MRVTLEDVAYRLLPRVSMGHGLAHREWLTLVAVAEVLLAGAAHEATPEQVANNVEAFLIAGHGRRTWRVRVLLQLIEYLPLTSVGSRFSRLPPDRRRLLIENKWIGGRRLWRICAKVRELVVLGGYGDLQKEVSAGYVPVPLRPRFKRLSPPSSEVA